MAMNPNVFDLRGPEFLAFYVGLLAVTLVVIALLRKWLEAGNSREFARAVEWLKENPYAIAYARGGGYETIRTAIVSLLERGLLKTTGSTIEAVRHASTQVTDPLDKALVLKFALPTAGREAMRDGIIEAEAESLAEPLSELGIMENSAIRIKRWGLIVGATFFLWLVGGTKIAVALSRGRTNIGFLIILLLITPVLVHWVVRRIKITTFGQRVIREVQKTFNFLQTQREEFDQRRTVNEITYLAAVYGLALLPTFMGQTVDKLQLVPPPKESNINWGHNFSSCSAGSCGGGGCGGGCGGGGCGGCGS